MELLFLATDGWQPTGPETDTVSLLINGEIMVDTGWHTVHNLLREKIDPREIHTLLLTHLHQDHCLGLPAFLFYLLNTYHDLSTVRLMGIKGVDEIAYKALDYAGKFRDYFYVADLKVDTIAAGDCIELPGLRVRFAPSHHTVPGLMMRFEDVQTGRVLVYTGDTSPSDETVAFAKGADVLIHEHSMGPKLPDDIEPSPGHSCAEMAACIARDAGVGQLYLVHADAATAQEALRCAKVYFPNTFRPRPGDRIVL